MCILFLDILIYTNNNKFTISSYRKPISINLCTVNYKRECPKIAIIKKTNKLCKN